MNKSLPTSYIPILVSSFLLVVIVFSCAPRRGNLSIAQGNALGIRHLPTMRPVRATLTFHCFFIVALTGRVGRFCIRLPRAMPWAMEILGFQPVFAQTLLVSRLCANVIGFTSLQTLLFLLLILLFLYFQKSLSIIS